MSAWDADKPPRRWQVEALPVALNALRARDPVVIQACTGAGKSYFTRGIVRSALSWFRNTEKWRILVCVPTRSLVKQTADAIEGVARVGKFYTASKQTARRQVIVVCNDSLAALADIMAVEGWRCGIAIVDEMHRSAADGVRAGLAAINPHARIGLTATPFRANQDEPIPGWSRVAYTYGIDDAISDGALVPFRVVRCREGQDVGANDTVLQMILDHAPPGPGVVSATSIDDAEWYAGVLTDHGVPAVAVHSRAPGRTTHALARLEAGELRCVVHVDLLTEGVDLPWLTWLAMRRHRKSAVAVVQEVGRILRAHPGKAEAVVLDPYGVGILGAIATDPNLGDPVERARALREAAERETSAGEVALPDAVPAEDAAAIVDALVSVVSGSLRVPQIEISHPDSAPSVRQLRLLEALSVSGDKKYCAASYVPERVREDLRRLVANPDHMTRQQASDAIAALQAVQTRARQARQTAGNRWRGPATWRIL